MTVAGAVLAAGGGTRFAAPEHKLRASFRGRPVVGWVLDAARDAAFDELLVVVGSVDLTDLVPDGATVVVNDRWAEGQSTSVGAAIDAARAGGHDAVVIGLGDQPLVPAEAWRAVGEAAGAIVTATFEGARRPPVKLHATVWDLVERTGDAGARNLMRGRPDLVVEVPCGGNPVDIDTVEDLRRWS